MPGSPPRLKDVFGTGFARGLATMGPPPKRIAPRRGDPPLTADAIERVAEAHDSNTAKGNRMPKYQMALDAAPQDGRWLDDPNAVTTVLQFFLSKLPPDQLAELDDHLTKGTAPQATDHRLPEGEFKRNLLNYTPKNRRSMVAAMPGCSPAPMMTADERKAIHDKLFPNAGRLK